MSSDNVTTIAAVAFTVALLALGLVSFGPWTTMIFTSGFAGGLVMFLIRPRVVAFESIKVPYFLALGLFVVHRVEEYLSGFFDRLAQETGVPTPDIASPQVIALVALSVGAWLLVPVLAGRHRFGSYLAWTFFCAMGVTELAHILVFPVVSGRPLQYFPGMASVFVLAPVAWWGLWRMWRAED